MRGFLAKLKLTLSQWVLVTGSAFIALLLFVLRIKNRRIHQLHVELTKTRYDNELTRVAQEKKGITKKTLKAEKAFYDAVDRYWDRYSPNAPKPPFRDGDGGSGKGV